MLLLPCNVYLKRHKNSASDVSRGSNPFIYTFCSLILNCLLLPSDTWYPESKKPVALETQGLQAKNDPIQSEQLTTICSDWVGSFTPHVLCWRKRCIRKFLRITGYWTISDISFSQPNILPGWSRLCESSSVILAAPILFSFFQV